MPYARNTTPIDDLMDLDDTNIIPNTSSSSLNTSKFIRNSGIQMNADSGMSPYNQSNQSNQSRTNQYFPPPKSSSPQQPPSYPQQPPSSPQQPPSSPQPRLKINNIPEIYTPNCIDIHNHVTQCPICSKFFKFDNSVYIISIIVLSIICILLLKKVLNV